MRGDFPCCVLPGCRGNASSRVSARSTEEEPFNRRAILSPAQDWPHREQLIESRFAMIDLSAGNSVALLEVDWREQLRGFDSGGDAGCKLLECPDHDALEPFTSNDPRFTPGRLVRHELDGC